MAEKEETPIAAVIINQHLTRIAIALYDRFGRPPTEEEVFGFILGTYEERRAIWNTF